MSLVEIIFSLFLLALVITLVMNVFPTSLLAVRQGENRLQAGVLAKSLLAEEMAKPYQELAPGRRQLDPVEVGAAVFEPTVEIFSTSRPADQSLGVRVTVSWEERRSAQEVVYEVHRSALQP